MALESFKIVFDSPTRVYYAGQTITGNIILNLESPKRVKALKVSFIGKAETKFQHQRTVKRPKGRSRRETINATGEETFYQYQYIILGGGSEVVIPAGENTYPFTARIFPTAPCSFEGKYGHIRYKVRATLDRPWQIHEHAEGTFEIVTPLDLNLCERAKAPVIKEDFKRFNCLCCKSGPLTMMISLPYTGFVPAGSLPFTIDVDNASDVKVTGVTVNLMRYIIYRATGSQGAKITSNTSIVKVDLGAVGNNDSHTWTENLIIPRMSFHNLTTCSIITMHYVLKAIAVASGAHFNLEIEVPLTLGSTPIAAPGPERATSVSPSIGLTMKPVRPAPAPPSASPNRIHPTNNEYPPNSTDSRASACFRS